MANIYIDKYHSKIPISMPQPHTHEHWEIQFLITGNRFYFIEETSYRLQSPIIIVIPPHVRHMTGGAEFERFNLNIFPQTLTEFEKSVLEKFSSQHAQRISAEKMEKFIELLEQLLSLPQNSRHETHAQCILSYLFFLIDTTLSQKTQDVQEQIKAPIIIYNIIDYIRCNLKEKLTLEKIAKNCNASVSYVRNQFQSYMQQSLYDYILTFRLNKAKDLLTTTSLSISKISEECGFSSSNYLCLIFKKKEGISPLAYKKLMLT